MTLLAINDEKSRHFLFRVCTNLTVAIADTVSPKEQITNWKALVHRVKEIPDFRIGPQTAVVFQAVQSHRFRYLESVY